VYRESKNRNLLFLAKASWSVKNVRGAIRVARAAGRRLEIVGGTTWFFNPWRGVHWNGYLGGINKAEIVASSEALLFPVLWDEPFGISVIEALVSGTPVLGSPFGSLPELIHPDVGFICKSEDEFVSAIDGLKPNQSKKCRDWVLSKFTYTQMVESYLKHYETVLQGQELNEKAPVASVATNAYQIPRLVGGVRALGLRHRYRAEAGRS
jgi:glycosyltransferase involved in cell wall biosynthesis